MKSEELKKKYDDSVERVNKRIKTIERQKKTLEKKRNVFKGCDWVSGHNDKFLEDIKYDMIARDRYKEETGRDLYWDICDVEDSVRTIEESYNKLEELKRISENWKVKYEKQLKLEDTIAFEMPEVFRECKEMLSKNWTEYDISKRDEMREYRKSVSWDEFRERYSYSTESSYDYTDEEFKKRNDRAAEDYIIDLYNRVKGEVGEVVSWDYIHLNGKALNGFIEGENGKVEVETILAGGPIRRLHQRVILHKMK